MTFLYDWQTLVGSAIGLFVAVILPLFGFLLQGWWNSAAERKETLRRIEVGSVVSLNETYNLLEQMRYAVRSISELASRVESVVNPSEFSFDSVNFPVTGSIYIDEDVLRFKTKSFYLHNKLLISSSLIKDLNRVIASLKQDFSSLLHTNELVVGKAKPSEQRHMYAQNLRAFASSMDDYVLRQFPVVLKTLGAVNVYNGLLRKSELLTLKKYEGWRVWPFSRRIQSEAIKNLSSVDQIDLQISDSVEALLDSAEKRRTQP